VSSRSQIVVPLHSQWRSTTKLPVSLEHLGVAVHELGDLRDHVELIVRDQHWSAVERRAACIPVVVRLPEAQQSLADLDKIRAGQWPDTMWAVRLRAARSEVERRLLDLSISMSLLMDCESSDTAAVASLTFDGNKLVQAVDELCALIADQYPQAVNNV
jgi:hypothetical protein